MSVEPKRNGASYSNSRRAEEYSAIESCALGWRITGGGERQQTKRSFDSYTRTLSDDFRELAFSPYFSGQRHLILIKKDRQAPVFFHPNAVTRFFSRIERCPRYRRRPLPMLLRQPELRFSLLLRVLHPQRHASQRPYPCQHR